MGIDVVDLQVSLYPTHSLHARFFGAKVQEDVTMEFMSMQLSKYNFPASEESSILSSFLICFRLIIYLTASISTALILDNIQRRQNSCVFLERRNHQFFEEAEF